jgi:hypothetical protein
MSRPLIKIREEARRLFLSGEAETNAQIAARLRLKPHTVGKWRRQEHWDDLKVKIDRRAAEMFSEKIASERVSLNLRHYRMWEMTLAKLAETLRAKATVDTRELERIASILNRAQQGQRVAKGLSLSGESEEMIRADSEATVSRLIDAFVESVRENVSDEEARERIRQSVRSALPRPEDPGSDDGDDPVA